MSIDAGMVGHVTAELMEVLDDQYEDGCEVDAVLVVVAVNVPSDEDGDEATSVRVRCSDSRPWVQWGLLDAARGAVDQ